MNKLLITATIIVLSFNFNVEAQSNNPKTMRQMLEAKLVASLPTQNDDTATVMPPQTNYTFLVSLLPTADNNFEAETTEVAIVNTAIKPEDKQTIKPVKIQNTDLR